MRSRRPGTVMVWLLISLSALIGVLALCVDGGRLYEERRRSQAAADAAALAAGQQLYYRYLENHRVEGTPDATAVAEARGAARATAARNGYSGAGTDPTVTVNVPPLSGPFAGQVDYAEVIIESRVANTFGKLLTGNPATVRTRAVARGRRKQIGILVLDPSATGAFKVSGNGSVLVRNGSICVNSTSSQAYHVTGEATVEAEEHNVTGGIQGSGAALIGTRRTGVPPTADPLASLPEPDPLAQVVQSLGSLSIVSSLPTTLLPGVYPGGLEVLGDGPVSLMPGLYLLGSGGLRLKGKGKVTGHGVTIYNGDFLGLGGCGEIEIRSEGGCELSPPTTGIYAGISIFQKRSSDRTIVIGGKGLLRVDGLIYAPGATVTVSGQGLIAGAQPGGSIIANQVEVSGNGSITLDPGNNRPRVPDVGLVE